MNVEYLDKLWTSCEHLLLSRSTEVKGVHSERIRVKKWYNIKYHLQNFSSPVSMKYLISALFLSPESHNEEKMKRITTWNLQAKFTFAENVIIWIRKLLFSHYRILRLAVRHRNCDQQRLDIRFIARHKKVGWTVLGLQVILEKQMLTTVIS